MLVPNEEDEKAATARLNQFGEQGWQVVFVLSGSTQDGRARVWFMREIAA